MDILEERARRFTSALIEAAATRGQRPHQQLVEALSKVNEEKEGLKKAGARHGKEDKKNLQKAHDCISKMCAGVVCGHMDKAGSRHSKADMDRLHKVHSLLSELGALCPGSGPMGVEEDE